MLCALTIRKLKPGTMVERIAPYVESVVSNGVSA
jgi:hypothetical protein